MKPLLLLFTAFMLPALAATPTGMAATPTGMAALTGVQVVLSLLVVRRLPC